MAKSTDDDQSTIEAGFTRPFADFLVEQARGKTHAELSDNLCALVEQVKATEKAGSLTLTIKVAPLKSNAEVLVVSDEIKLKLPEHDRPTSLFYADDDGNLVRDNPNQLAFEGIRGVETVDRTTGEVKKEKHA